MSKIRGQIHCLLTIIAASLCGLLGWKLLQTMSSTPPSQYQLKFPQHQDLVAIINTTFLCQEVETYQEGPENFLKVQATIRGKPQPMHNGMNYQCLLDSLTINDAKGYVIMAFQRDPDKTIQYHVDPLFSQQRRQQIFDAFHVNINNNDYSDDRSLLQQPFDIFITKEGLIKEIFLSSILRNAIYDNIIGLKMAPLIKRLLNASHRLPSLFQGSTGDRWQTQGDFFGPLVLSHEVIDKDEHTMKIASTSSTQAKDKYQRTIDNRWRLEWDYDRRQQYLTHVELDIGCCYYRKFFNNVNRNTYTIKGTVELRYEVPTPAIAEL